MVSVPIFVLVMIVVAAYLVGVGVGAWRYGWDRSSRTYQPDRDDTDPEPPREGSGQ